MGGRSPGRSASGGMGRDGSTRKMERSEALARDKPGMYQHQREVENSISITMQSYTHVGWRHNDPGVTGAPL